MIKKVLGIILVAVFSIFISIPVFAEEATATTQSTDGGITIQTADTGTINGSNVRLRATPSTSGTIVMTMQKGQQVEISDSQEPVSANGYVWIYVLVVGTNKSGWVAQNYVTYTPV